MVAQNAQNTQLDKPQSKDENIFSLTEKKKTKKQIHTPRNKKGYGCFQAVHPKTVNFNSTLSVVNPQGLQSIQRSNREEKEINVILIIVLRKTHLCAVPTPFCWFWFVH